MLQLLYGLMLQSANDAAVAIAIDCSGTVEAFADLMNEKAASMGLVGTHFTNCTGLHDADHYSTPVEMAMILAYAMQYKECADILSTYRYTTAPTEKHPEGVALESTMFSRMYGDEPEGATILAGKTGYTNEAHHCLVSYAEDDETGAAYIFVSTSAKEKFAPVFDAIAVYSEYTKRVSQGLPFQPTVGKVFPFSAQCVIVLGPSFRYNKGASAEQITKRSHL